MTKSLVARLRNRIHDAPLPTEYLIDEAADEIERLERELTEAKEHIDSLEGDRD